MREIRVRRRPTAWLFLGGTVLAVVVASAPSLLDDQVTVGGSESMNVPPLQRRTAPAAPASVGVPGVSGVPESLPVATATTSSPAPMAPVAPRVGETPDPTSRLVLVDADRYLPDGYVPAGLVAPRVRFIFSGASPKRLMRLDAAIALEELFDAADLAGAPLSGVSAYRSAATQRDLYGSNVHRRGAVEASQLSALPGHSEHQTGLAIDVTGADGRCPASACFAGTIAAAWLATHAWEHGFIVRYPAGQEAVTGFHAEPWHLRFVDLDAARRIHELGVTLDQYLGAGGDGSLSVVGT